MPNPLFYTSLLTWDIQTNAKSPILHISPHLGFTDQCPAPYFTHLPSPGIYLVQTNAQPPTLHISPHLGYTDQCCTPFSHISPHLVYTIQCPTPFLNTYPHLGCRVIPNPLFTHLPSSGIYKTMPNPLFYTFPLTWDIQNNAQPPILHISPHLGYTEQCPTPYFTHLPSPGTYKTMPNPLFYTFPLTWDIQTNAQPPTLHSFPHG